MARWLVVAFVLCAGPALAQEAQGPPGAPTSSREQAMSGRISFEVNTSIACNAKVIDITQELAAAQAEAKALKDKYEPAPPTAQK